MLPHRDQLNQHRVKHTFLITDILQRNDDNVKDVEAEDDDDLVSTVNAA